MSLWETHMGSSAHQGFSMESCQLVQTGPGVPQPLGLSLLITLPVRAETRQDPLPGGHYFLSQVTERPSLLSLRTDETHAAPRVPRWFRLPL